MSVIGSCVDDWQLCRWLAVVSVVGICIGGWQLCRWLAVVSVIGSCVGNWQLRKEKSSHSRKSENESMRDKTGKCQLIKKS